MPSGRMVVAQIRQGFLFAWNPLPLPRRKGGLHTGVKDGFSDDVYCRLIQFGSPSSGSVIVLPPHQPFAIKYGFKPLFKIGKTPRRFVARIRWRSLTSASYLRPSSWRR